MDRVVARAPDLPGAYRFYDAQGKVLYVGKAKNIRSRIRNHLADREGTARHSLLLLRTRSVDWILVPDEDEALILEDALIKQHRPPFNIRFRDDKRYPLIRLGILDPFPTLSVVRLARKDGALYYGPYTSARSMRAVLKIIDRYFPLQKCKNAADPGKHSPCLHFQMKRCPGVCRGMVTRDQYLRTVRKVQLLLEGRSDELINQLSGQMQDHAAKLDFENAARLRDQIQSVQRISTHRQLLLPKPINMDIFAIGKHGGTVMGETIYVRRGIISGNRQTFIDPPEDIPNSRLMSAFLIQHYNQGIPVPVEIIVSDVPENLPGILRTLHRLSGRKPHIHRPLRGRKVRLLHLAETNLNNRMLTREVGQSDSRELESLMELLNLSRVPERIEAVDISESGGRNIVGSVVCFKNGKPEPSRYRRYRIRSTENADDCSSIYEVMKRRLKRAGEKGWELPDLFVIDGGKGQLNAAVAALSDSHHRDTAVVSLAKIRNNRRTEGVFLPSGREINPDVSSPAAHCLDRIRDEAHRFTIGYHRKLRHEKSLKARFREIPGVGPYRRKLLLDHFKTLDKIRKATVQELARLPGIGPETAGRIRKAMTPPSPGP